MKKFLVIVTALFVVLSAHAQDYKAMYKAADEYGRKYNAGYFNGSINSRPIAKTSSFIYSVNAPGGMEYYVVNAETGEIKFR